MILDYISNASGLPFEQQITQNFTPELQWTPSFEISILMAGFLEIHYKNHTRRFRCHDIFFFLPFETYTVTNADPSTRVLTIRIDSDYIDRLCPENKTLTIQQNHVSCDMSNDNYLQLCRDFSVMIFITLKHEVTSRLKLIQAVNDMVILLFDNYGVRISDNVLPEYSRERIIQILQYINENYMHKLTVKDIASHLGVHPQYFSTLFQKNFHTGFLEYLNTFRVNHSIEELLYTNHSILEISLNHGFSNHKTYASAFRKLYLATPTEYRKQFSQQIGNPDALLDDQSEDYDASNNSFSYFRQFLQPDNAGHTELLQKNRQALDLNIQALKKSAQKNTQKRFLSLGRAYACLRSEVQEQIRMTIHDYPFDYLRIRDIFSDDLYIYYEKENSEPLYNWASLDTVFDFILSVGLKPFPEIGYMPAMLASKKQYANWQYHPNISQPKSLQKWKLLILDFLRHYIGRYGIRELRSWYFDFWTDPDLKIKNPYWNESMEAFFEFYLVTWQAFHETDPDLQLGSPSFSSIYGFPWYESFFSFCNEHFIRPAYISAHLYGCEGEFSKDLMEDTSYYSVTNQRLVADQIQTVQEIMNRYKFHDLEIIVSDWNLTFLPSDLIRDTCYMGPYICHTLNQTMHLVKGISFWALSDNYEDFFPDNRLFQGGAGLLDFHSLKKAAYNAFTLIGMLGSRILSQGKNYIFTMEENTYQLLFYNLPQFDYMYSILDHSIIDETHRYNIYGNVENLLLSISLQLPKGTYYIKRYEVSREYGSAYDIWGRMGFPPVLTKDMEDYLRESSVPHISYSYQDIEHTLLLDEAVPAHGVLLLSIIPK